MDKKNTKIYLDMDGVLADFFGAWADMAGVNYWKDIPDDQVNATLDKMVGTDFFNTLPKFPTANTLIDLAKSYTGEYYINSSPLRNDHDNSGNWKKVWIKRELATQPKGIIITDKKATYAVNADGSPNILIDDRGANIAAWTAKGGIGIKYQADENTISEVRARLDKFFNIAPGQDPDAIDDITEDAEQKMSSEQMLAKLSKEMQGTHTGAPDPSSDWSKYVLSHKGFTLKDIQVDKIPTAVKSDGMSQANIEKYKKADTTKFPPVVIGDDGYLLDGNHRLQAYKYQGIKTIKAYVGESTVVTEDVAYVEPQFDAEWEEANRYPYIRKLGREGWRKLAKTGKTITVNNNNVKKIGNTGADGSESLDELEPKKVERFKRAMDAGTIEMPIVIKQPNGSYDLVAGNTRLIGLMNTHGEAKVWLVDANKLKQPVKESFDTQVDWEIDDEMTQGDGEAYKANIGNKEVGIQYYFEVVDAGGFPLSGVDITFEVNMTTKKTGTGDASTIFGAVVNHIKQFINQHDEIDAIEFSASKEQGFSRTRLYSAMVEKLSQGTGFINAKTISKADRSIKNADVFKLIKRSAVNDKMVGIDENLAESLDKLIVKLDNGKVFDISTLPGTLQEKIDLFLVLLKKNISKSKDSEPRFKVYLNDKIIGSSESIGNVYKRVPGEDELDAIAKRLSQGQESIDEWIIPAAVQAGARLAPYTALAGPLLQKGYNELGKKIKKFNKKLKKKK